MTKIDCNLLCKPSLQWSPDFPNSFIGQFCPYNCCLVGETDSCFASFPEFSLYFRLLCALLKTIPTQLIYSFFFNPAFTLPRQKWVILTQAECTAKPKLSLSGTLQSTLLFLCFYFICASPCPHVYMYATCVPGICEVQKKMSRAESMSCCKPPVGAGNQPRVLCKTSK